MLGLEDYPDLRGPACYPAIMPRWFLALVVAALGLSLAGGVLIFLRSPTPVAQRVE